MVRRNVVSEKQLSEREAAYVAGLIDGEGTLTIGRETRPENRSGFRYSAILMVANTNVAGLEQAQKLCGNGRIDCSVAAHGRNQKPVYRLWFSPNQIRHLLPQIEPYLVIKRRQADVLRRFLDIAADGRNAPNEHWNAIEQMRAEVRSLNFRGATDETDAAATIFIRDAKPHPRMPPKGCSVHGCTREHASKGYCHPHYKVYVLRGGPARYERVCEHCQTRFITGRHQTRFCSKACNDKRWRVRNRKPSP